MTHDHHQPRAGLAELLTLDAGLATPLLTELLEVAASAAGRPADIVDIGSGSGTGTVALARRFPTARVTAVDISAELLARARATADEEGVGARVTTHLLEVDQPGTFGPADLLWAASVLHEIHDVDTTLQQWFAATRPGGLLVVVEMDTPPTYLPDPSLEQRMHRAMAQRGKGHPHRPDWAQHLESAGFTVERVHTAELEVTPDEQHAVSRSAELYLGRIGPVAADLLDEADRDLLRAELGHDALRHRTDLVYRSSRTGWLARRPA